MTPLQNPPLNTKILYCLIGPSGSGKSTAAKKLAPDNCICEADKYWLNCVGDYLFVPQKLGQAHAWCQSEVNKLMINENSRIVVSNTSLTEKERGPYRELAKKHGYEFHIVLPNSPWFEEVRPKLLNKTFTDEDIKLFCEKSTHGVPFESMKKMFERYAEN